MASHPHHTKSDESVQTDDAWIRDILPLLPPDLEEQAHILGAVIRQRSFDSAADLLRALLAYVTVTSSLRHLGCWAVIQDIADLAPSSWLERLRAASPWLQWIVSSFLTHPRPRWLPQAWAGRILLVDASRIALQGGTGDDLRLHLAYDLGASQFDQVVLTDQQGAEQVQHFTIRPGDLLVMDAGYAYRSRCAHLQNAKAHGLFRIYAPSFPLETATGQPFAIRTWLDRIRGDQQSQVAYYRHDGRRYAVRVLAMRMPETRRMRAQRRAANRARKRQRPVSEVVQYYADWVILVCTIMDDETWPDDRLWRLYGARWQIELIFKQLKQQLGLGQVRGRTVASGRAWVWALLLVWVLHEPYRRDCTAALQELAEPHPATLPGDLPTQEAVVSAWGVSTLLLDTIVHAIRGTWTLARLQACLPRLRRYLVSHPREDRPHQLTEVLAWLNGIRRTRRRPLPDAL
jgi:hypothetical protein